jgi:hypothetical protein
MVILQEGRMCCGEIQVVRGVYGNGSEKVNRYYNRFD